MMFIYAFPINSMKTTFFHAADDILKFRKKQFLDKLEEKFVNNFKH